MKLVVKFANEIKDYCKSRNTCYGCPFFDEETAIDKHFLENSKRAFFRYEDACSLRDRPMFWKDCGASMVANDEQVTGKLNSEIVKSNSEIVPDYRDGWRLRGIAK